MAKTILSASKIKTLRACSYQYFCQYVKKIPGGTNVGAQLGSIAHIVFEVLGNTRHLKHYKKIISKKDVFASKSIKRLILKHLNKDNIHTEENELNLKKMILTGLNADFFGTKHGKPLESISEFEFNINHKCENLEYNIKGFIDKLFVYEKMILVKDFKTSKKAFEGKDIISNIQADMYVLAIKKTYPHIEDVRMEFLFLKEGILDDYFKKEKEKPRQIHLEIEDLQIKIKEPIEQNLSDHVEIDGCAMKMKSKSHHEYIGFQYELHDIQKYADNFNEKTALSNLAARQEFPKDGSFTGPLLCGFAKKPGQLKKNGEKMFHCAFKFPKTYFALLDEKGEIVKTSDNKDDLIKLKTEKNILKKMEYKGCPAFCS